MTDYYNGADLSFTKGTLEQEQELFRRAKTGDQAAVEEIVKMHALFAANTARNMIHHGQRDPEHVEQAISVANTALMNAIPKYDYSRGHRFVSFLKVRIAGALTNFWRTRARERKIFTAQQDNPEFFAPSGSYDNVEENVNDRERRIKSIELIHKYLDRFTDFEKMIIEEIYTNGKTPAQIGRERKCTREWIRRSHEALLRKFRRYLTEDETKELR